MTNKEEGRKLIREAERIFNREVNASLRSSDWNLAVRRSQETVEMALKGALKILGIDYPKVHDVGAVFAEQARKKIERLDERTVERIREISSKLAKERAPSFYFEKEYSEKDARMASEDASFVLRKIKEIFMESE